jgi:hypothetical protein
MFFQRFLSLSLLATSATAALAQAPTTDLTGIWGPYRGGRGSDPKFAPPAATPVVLKPEYAKPYDERRAVEAEATKRGEQLVNTSAQCLPQGVPTMMAVASYPVEIIQTPRQVTMISEAFSEVRRVYMNQPQAQLDDVAPGYYGRSVGHWEGDTLVVNTIGIKTTVRYRGMPHSEQMRVDERFKMLSSDILHDQITITDPVVLEKPMTYTLAYKRLAKDYEMVEFVCDNNREFVDDKGVVRLKLKDQ